MTASDRAILPLGHRARVLDMVQVDKTFNGTVAALKRMNLDRKSVV